MFILHVQEQNMKISTSVKQCFNVVHFSWLKKITKQDLCIIIMIRCIIQYASHDTAVAIRKKTFKVFISFTNKGFVIFSLSLIFSIRADPVHPSQSEEMSFPPRTGPAFLMSWVMVHTGHQCHSSPGENWLCLIRNVHWLSSKDSNRPYRHREYVD